MNTRNTVQCSGSYNPAGGDENDDHQAAGFLHDKGSNKASELMKKRCAEGKNDAFIYSDSRPKPVQCIETGVVYSSQNEAYRMTGIRHIHEACTGAYVYAGGFHWRFVNQVKPGIIPAVGRGGKKRQA